ncbi:probable G-protein coupled receptor Mth-like 3 isoform X2 [Daktulosphaira vitifoliae]|uniref:probable G-protein coupled receptor Mth-like 3 isoform X2 n=1 Tax=Daktulosphaira vitifoliae TaxID=58002 RepID=UPI0021AA67B5|nr:probable G-protein coupled receptor Mth-like 3 isoform X2 [Daktulosphaira vitifoliae]
MYAVRSCVLLLLVAAKNVLNFEELNVTKPAPLCCKTPGGQPALAKCVGTVFGTVFKFNEIVPLYGSVIDTDNCKNGATADETDKIGAIVALQKCCPSSKWYDVTSSSCRFRPKTDGWPRLIDVLLDLDRSTAIDVNDSWAVGYNYNLPKCNKSDVIVDLPVEVNAYRMLTGSPNDRCVDFKLAPRWHQTNGLVMRGCRPRRDHCKNNTCVRKCCLPNKLIVGEYCNETTDMPLFSPPIVQYNTDSNEEKLENVTILPLYQIKCDRYPLKESFHILPDGSLYQLSSKLTVPHDEYCIDYYAENFTTQDIVMKAFICFDRSGPTTSVAPDQVKGSWKYIVLTAGIVPSLICLTITLIVYGILTSLRNMHGYYIMCYVACLLISYSCLLIVNWKSDDLSPPICTTIGYVTLFAFLASFCWLNVICFDIYWTLRYTNTVRRKTSISKRTIFYNIYCWTFAMTCTCLTVAAQFYGSGTIPEQLLPNMGSHSCWFTNSNNSIVVFFLVPMSIMLLVNIFLFLLTAMHCVRIKSELNKFKRSDTKTKRFQAEKEKFIMSIKLFLVMGISWTSEVLGRILPQLQYVWEVLDSVNSLQGVLIFFVFVLKRKVLSDLKKKLKKSCDLSKDSTKIYTVSGTSQNGSSRKTSSYNF